MIFKINLLATLHDDVCSTVYYANFDIENFQWNQQNYGHLCNLKHCHLRAKRWKKLLKKHVHNTCSILILTIIIFGGAGF